MSIGSSKRGKLLIFWITGLFVLMLDQLSKRLVRETLPVGSASPVIPGFFNLVHVENPGVAFSILADNPTLLTRLILILIALIAVVVLNTVVARSGDNPGRGLLIPYGLILGGALGNLYDRITRGMVTDFLDFYIGDLHWPAFNLADGAITVGAIFLIIATIRTPGRPG
ncbi:signal peptidase II [Thermodesulforhabdus norvegica]|uniref:Lipoprotein signal peptidase n=1 Tax=Thermodesulforhabdus norvegica TaxID=39841 RepID=A0A1I4TYJ5_9BACT|nr:signal peptidase II [Thermodesulforhabdus norvegica]SFM81640.1 signal peptidase II [Thermodesulforhabdus norvegica]